MGKNKKRKTQQPAAADASAKAEPQVEAEEVIPV